MVFRVESSAGHYAVQVRVQAEVSGPGMQHRGPSQLRAELSASEVEQRLRCGVEEEIVHRARIPPA